MRTALAHPDASILVQQSNGKRLISVEPRGGLFIHIRECATDYPLELIKHVLRVKKPAYLCDEIMRDEDPNYVQHDLYWSILSYAGKEDFSGKQVLDFGSGCGASSMVFARMFPDVKIVGVELVPEFLELAQRRAKYHGIEDRVCFRRSPDSNSLPPDIGSFDYVLLIGVYEHLLPTERHTVLKLVWSHLKQGGVMFLIGTPYRWFPIDLHTTNLPLINYLPDGLALYYARRFSKRVNRDVSWSELLRRGVRGGTPREIMTILNRGGGRAEFLEPSHLGVKDRIDLWYKCSVILVENSLVKSLMKWSKAGSGHGPDYGREYSPVKSLMKWSFRLVKAATGMTIVPDVSLAIRKVR